MSSSTAYPATHRYAAEFVGTFVLMFFGLSGISIFANDQAVMLIPNVYWRLLGIGLAFGVAIYMVVKSRLGVISGAHINPAVSLWALLKKQLTPVQFTFYLTAQIFGALAATALVAVVFSQWMDQVAFGVTLPGAEYGVAAAFSNELVSTFLLVFAIIICTKIKEFAPHTGLMVGILVAAIVVATAQISGASINPARSFAPAIFSNNYQYLWVYLTAPMLGSLLAFKTEQVLFAPAPARRKRKPKN